MSTAYFFNETINLYTYESICVLFGPVKLELGVIPSGQENYSKVNI